MVFTLDYFQQSITWNNVGLSFGFSSIILNCNFLEENQITNFEENVVYSLHTSGHIIPGLDVLIHTACVPRRPLLPVKA